MATLRRFLILFLTFSIVLPLLAFCFRFSLRDRFEALSNPQWLNVLQWTYAIIGSLLVAFLLFRPSTVGIAETTSKLSAILKSKLVFAAALCLLIALVITPWNLGAFLPKVTPSQLSLMPSEAQSIYAAAQKGNSYSAGRFGILLFENHMEDTAHWYLKTAAHDHDGEACLFLARMYEDGRGVQKDEEETIKWILAAVENGEPAVLDYLKTSPAYQKRIALGASRKMLSKQFSQPLIPNAQTAGSQSPNTPAPSTPEGTGIYTTPNNRNPLGKPSGYGSVQF